MDIDSLVLKGKVDCFPNWHETQLKLSVDTKPNRPLEAKCCTRKEDAWPSWACQSVREGIEETTIAATTTETGVVGGKRRLSTGNIRPTLGLILSFCHVLESCTIHPE